MKQQLVELVFVPSPGIGHLISAVEFIKRLLDRHDGLSVTVLLIQTPAAPTFSAESFPDTSRLRYIPLPRLDPPPFSGSVESLFTTFVDRHKTLVRDAIARHAANLAGMVLDMFCTSMIDVAKELDVPSYIFFTSGAHFLGFMLYLPVRHELVGAEFTESGPDSVIPGFVNPVPTAVLPMFSFNDLGYSSFLTHARRFEETRGIIVNTFAELEPHAVGSFLTGNYRHVPPVYTVGPLLDLSGRRENGEILTWLDGQPASSVVFLCFGSYGSFGEAQLREIAEGLGRSGARFVWAIRKPMSEGMLNMPGEYTDGELREILPKEFMERAEKGEMGMVCGWAPQKQVLGHRAVGGFVSHCGWNSVLESVWHGVPIATWPMYAEQQICAFELVKELGVAVETRMGYKMGQGEIVGAAEVERAIRSVMESDSEVRSKVKKMSDKSRKAVADGGSSFTNIRRFVQDILS